MRMSTSEKAILAACAGIYLAACVTAEAVAPTPKPAPFSSAREKAVVTAQTGHAWPEAVSLGNPTPLSDDLYLEVQISSAAYGIPLCLALGLIEIESGFDTEAISPKGCYGLCQLNPIYHPSGLSPKENIKTGLKFLGELLSRYQDYGAALTAYHAGRDTGSRTYAQKVLDAANLWEEVFYASVDSHQEALEFGVREVEVYAHFPL